MINTLWIYSDRMGCGSYRCWMPALGLKESGISDSYFLSHEEAATRVDDAELDDVQVVVFQRAVGPPFVELMKKCKSRGIATIVEFDDDLFNVSRKNPASWFWLQKPVQRLFRQQLEMADHVIVSTVPLRDTVLDETRLPASHVAVCCNHLHPAAWGPDGWSHALPYPNQSLVIGWQGSGTHDVDFKMAIPALKRITEKFPQTVLRFMGTVPLSLRHAVPDQRIQWTKGVAFDRYPATLRYVNFTMGLAPVTDSRFNRCKSNIKWLEYSALKIPCVASRVYPYAESIDHGRTGFLADTPSQWYDALHLLVTDPETRTRIGEAAYTEAWSTWGTQRWIPAWADVLRSVCPATPSLTPTDALTTTP